MHAAPEYAAENHGLSHHAEGYPAGLEGGEFPAAGHDAELDHCGEQKDHGQNLGDDQRHLDQKVGGDHGDGNVGLDKVVQTFEQVGQDIQADPHGQRGQQNIGVVLGQIAEKQAHAFFLLNRMFWIRFMRCGVRSRTVR